ncbi:hypothetical protein FQZ97_667270 [compost metagenome]
MINRSEYNRDSQATQKCGDLLIAAVFNKVHDIRTSKERNRRHWQNKPDDHSNHLLQLPLEKIRPTLCYALRHLGKSSVTNCYANEINWHHV